MAILPLLVSARDSLSSPEMHGNHDNSYLLLPWFWFQLLMIIVYVENPLTDWSFPSHHHDHIYNAHLFLFLFKVVRSLLIYQNRRRAGNRQVEPKRLTRGTFIHFF